MNKSSFNPSSKADFTSIFKCLTFQLKLFMNTSASIYKVTIFSEIQTYQAPFENSNRREPLATELVSVLPNIAVSDWFCYPLPLIIWNALYAFRKNHPVQWWSVLRISRWLRHDSRVRATGAPWSTQCPRSEAGFRDTSCRYVECPLPDLSPCAGD